MLKQYLTRYLTGLIVLLSLFLTSCSAWDAAPHQTEASEPVPTVQNYSPAEEEVAAAAPPAEKAEAAPEVAALPAGEDASVAGGAPMPSLMATASPVTADAPASAEMERSGESPAAMPQQTGPLRAGEVDDNARWDDYLLYRRNYQGLPVHDRDISERYIVEVVDEQGQPVLGAQVRFLLPGQNQEIYSARTYANGQVLFHPLALSQDALRSLEQVERFAVEVTYGEEQEVFSLTRLNSQASTTFTDRWTVTLAANRPQEALGLDILFLVDATGSMSDEITKIQSTIFDVSAQIEALPGQPEVRYGLVTYRDRGDSFVTRSYDFTPDVRDFSQNLNTLFADGGGDYPESLNEALHEAIHGVEWRGAGAIQLIFLIADAPPHLDYEQDYDYAVEMDEAAQRGIKIFPLASSGLDEQGEYIFRQIAQYTQGRFLFLTYEGPTNGGAPGDVTTHHVEDYSVENLDALLVKLVAEELVYQNPQLAGQ